MNESVMLTIGEKKVLKAFRALIDDPEEEQVSVSLSDGRTITLTLCGPAQRVVLDDDCDPRHGDEN